MLDNIYLVEGMCPDLLTVDSPMNSKSLAKQTLTRKFTRTRKLKVCIEQFQAKAEHSEPPNTGLAGSISFRLPGLNSARGP